MKIAVVISGLARFPEQGFPFLERIIEESDYEIDVYAGLWDIDSIPESISSKLKKVVVIPCGIRDALYFLLEDNFLTNKQLSLDCVKNQHAGLISHMATCTALKDDLLNYDLIIKWRWDVAIQPGDFNLICKEHLAYPDWIISDNLCINEGTSLMNEVVFSARPNIMLAAFTPLEDKFLQLGRLLQADAITAGVRLKLGGLNSFTKLISSSFASVRVVPFKWALLRENILDNLEYVQCRNNTMLLKLQQAHDKERDKKINSSI